MPTKTTTKRYDELVPGDRIVLPYPHRGLIRTVASVGPNGTLNRYNKPLWTVLYVEGPTDGWGGGNSGLPSHVVEVIAEPSRKDPTP